MGADKRRIKSVAIIGAGAAGAVTAAALAAENYFDRIQVFERRESAGGTWIYDGDPTPLPLQPGKLPPETDPPLAIPSDLPKITSPNHQERFLKTPIYDSLTTNVPAIAMSFSDLPFAYGPFVPHHVPRQYVENYFSAHKLDTPANLTLNTTVEDLSFFPQESKTSDLKEGWKLTLRRRDLLRNVDEWWEEKFDAVILANGHYAVPYIPEVKGLQEYIDKFPGRIVHSKTYRSPRIYSDKKVLVIGNSASGHDISLDLIPAAKLPVYQSRRSVSRFDGDKPPPGIEWKPIITEFQPGGRIFFDDGTHLDDIDTVIYCTGYLPSYPFWNSANNHGRPFWDYEKRKLAKTFQHTFFQDFATLAVVGVPRTLTFRSFEYQAIAIARLWAGRAARQLPSVREMEEWETDREGLTKGKKFHDIDWDGGETVGYLTFFYELAGLAGLLGDGRNPPRLSKELRWALKHLKKYPEPGRGDGDDGSDDESDDATDDETNDETESLGSEAGEVDGKRTAKAGGGGEIEDETTQDWVVVERLRG